MLSPPKFPELIISRFLFFHDCCSRKFSSFGSLKNMHVGALKLFLISVSVRGSRFFSFHFLGIIIDDLDLCGLQAILVLRDEIFYSDCYRYAVQDRPQDRATGYISFTAFTVAFTFEGACAKSLYTVKNYLSLTFFASVLQRLQNCHASKNCSSVIQSSSELLLHH